MDRNGKKMKKAVCVSFFFGTFFLTIPTPVGFPDILSNGNKGVTPLS
jgi:hypothetical protein